MPPERHRTDTLDQPFGQADSGPELRAGARLADRFVLGQPLGQGATGRVWAALDTRVGQKVAVKVLHAHLTDERSRERLRREVRLSRPGHPNAVTVYELHEHDDIVFLSMELVEGESLSAVLEHRARLPGDEVIALGRSLAEALAHLHDRALVHRDVKPGNVLLARDGAVKLCDMGLARPVEQGGTVTETAMMVGTPAYMAPEQATGADLTTASDVYGLGLTLYQCLTGEVPLKGDGALDTLWLRRSSRPPHLRDSTAEAPRWLDRLLRQMLEPDPRDRPAAAQVARALERRAVRPRPRRRLVLAAAAIVTLTLAGGLTYRLVSRGETVRMEALGTHVSGLDARGRTTWRYELIGEVRQEERADLDGDGDEELIVVTSQAGADERDGERTPAEVLVVSASGDIRTWVQPEEVVALWPFPYPRELDGSVVVGDLDGDGVPELVLTCRQVNYYPSAILVYWSLWDQWQHVLNHDGHVYAVTVAPQSAGGGIRFLAVNNRMGLTRVVGHVDVVPPPAREGMPRDAGASRRFYVLLGEHNQLKPMPAGIAVRPTGETVTSLPGRERLLLDASGNPTHGPNAGKDLSLERRRFLAHVSGLEEMFRPVGAAGVAARVAAAEQDCAEVLREPAYRAVLGLFAARALARSGDLAQALATLRSTRERAPFDDVLYRLAHLEALAGRYAEGARVTAQLMQGRRTVRARFDAQRLALRLAVEQRQPEVVAQIVPMFRGVAIDRMPGLGAALWARTHLWWDELGPSDCEVASYSYAPDGEAVACLARWRLGRTRPADPEAMRRHVEQYPDAAWEGRLAVAAAQLGLGRAEDALSTLGALLPELEPVSRDDLLDRQVLDLARAVRAKALLAAGATERAQVEAERLVGELTPGLLPAILAGEVLSETGASPQGR